MAKGYWIAQVRVTGPEQYRKYVSGARAPRRGGGRHAGDDRGELIQRGAEMQRRKPPPCPSPFPGEGTPAAAPCQGFSVPP